MALLSRIFRIPRPRTFLYLMSLRTGTELITLTVLLNKISGLYGLLALLTGLHLSPLQFSMYIYSVLALVLTAFLSSHIRKESPLQCLALAWFYILDSAVNAAYTAAFGVTWFLVVSQHHSESSSSKAPGGQGGQMMDETAGFTKPEFNVSHVDVVATPGGGVTTGQDAVAVGSPGAVAATAISPSLGHGILQPESVWSIFIIAALWAVRLYFIFVIMAYARSVLHIHLLNSPNNRPGPNAADPRNPFDATTEQGQGWKGRLGRFMVSIGRGYWLGTGDEDNWARGMDGKFSRKGGVSSVSNSIQTSGPEERERRRRSGTGPPPPPAPAPEMLRSVEIR
ncbi:MAG: hypothetical protein M4579_003402 [Chaenotheca gracillima]|nr:MAG: hypothetical protein M4579_003402 [Chaenotheca gracillima]